MHKISNRDDTKGNNTNIGILRIEKVQSCCITHDLYPHSYHYLVLFHFTCWIIKYKKLMNIANAVKQTCLSTFSNERQNVKIYKIRNVILYYNKNDATFY